MLGDYAADSAALRLWLELWENQRRCATAVLNAERRADKDVKELLTGGLPEARAEIIRESLFYRYVEDQGIHRSIARFFLRFRTVAPVWLEAETRAFAGLGRVAEQLGRRGAWNAAEQAMREYAEREFAGDETSQALLEDLQRGRTTRVLAQGVRVLRTPEPVPEKKIEAAASASRAFDEAVGDDQLAGEFQDLAWAQSRYAERRPSVRAGDVEVFVRKHPNLPGRQLVARHGDGHEVVLTGVHQPNIVFPRVYPDGFWLEPRYGRHLVYSSQASGDESGAMLTVADTRTGEVKATIAGAEYPGVAWLNPEAFVWVGGSGTRHGARRFDLATGTSEQLVVMGNLEEPSVLRSVVGSGNALRAAERAWAVVSSDRGPHGSENKLEAVDPYDSSRRTALLTYADATLGRALVTADNRLIVVSWSVEHPRGRIAEVPLDLGRKRIPPEEWRDIGPDDGESVIREVVAVDRGPGQDPLFAISRTRHGAAEVQLFDPTTGRGTSVPLEELGLPGVYKPDGSREAGVFGQITAMTAGTGPDGTSVVEFEHSSIVSSPRTFGVSITPHGAGPAEEIPREGTVADKVLAGARVTRHTFLAPPSLLAPDERTVVRGLLVEHADAPGAGPLMFTSYSNYFVGNNTGKPANHVHSTHFAAGGRLWINEGRGTGSEGYEHFRDGVRLNQFGAVMDVVAGIDHIVDQGIAEKGAIHTSAQSSGPMIMLRAVAQRPEAVGSQTVRRPDHDGWQILAGDNPVGYEFEAPTSISLASWNYLDPGIRMPELTIVIGAPDDPRIHDRAAHDLSWQLMTTSTETLLHIARPGRGHFADEQEAARELSALWHSFEYRPPSELRPGLLGDIHSARGQANRLSAAAAQAVASAASGLTPVTHPAQHVKSTARLPEHSVVNNRAHTSHLALTHTSKPSPKYAGVHLETKLGGINRNF